MTQGRKGWLFIALAVLLAALTPVLAQEYRGNLFAEIQDESGNPVAGATVTLAGGDFSRTATSDAQGKVRFTKLEPGTYRLTAAAPNMKSIVLENIEVNTLSNIVLPVKLAASTQMQEQVVVTAQTPLLDQRKVGTSTITSQEELSQIPTSRDPWSVLSTVPGITTDRVNVGGNEAGQQANFLGKGDDGANTTWVMDGIEFTDLGAIGSSPSYFDFNTFEEIGFVTGGAAPDQPNGGIRLNFTTKQGANEVAANIRLYYTSAGLQSGVETLNQPANVVIRQPGTNGPGDIGNNLLPNNQITEVFEKNFNIGGPIWKDHIWYWFGFGQNDIDNSVSGISDKTKLKNTTFKVHGQAATKFNWKLFYTNGNKTKDGRGAAVTRPAETTWNQKGPTPIYTAYGSWNITPNWEMSLQYGHVDGKFSLTPKGGLDAQAFNDADNIWHGTYVLYDTVRPMDQAVLTGTNFANTGDWEHEIKYGYRYKTSTVESLSKWGNEDFFVYSGAYIYMYRERNFSVDMKHHNAWAGDTMTHGNWAITVGLSYTKQEGNNNPSSVPGVGICATCLPGLNYAGAGSVFDWSDTSPRLGLTYTFDTAKRLLLRANYSRYVDQMFSGDISYDNPQAAYLYITMPWLNPAAPRGLCSNNSAPCADDSYCDPGATCVIGTGDTIINPGEFSTNPCADAWNSSVDPCNPNAFADVIDPNYKAPKTDEIILGGEVEIARDFTVAVDLTWRTRDRGRWYEGNLDGRPVAAAGPLYDVNVYAGGTGPLVPLLASDYDCSTLLTGTFPDGTPYSVPYCDLNASGLAKTNDLRPSFLTNQPGYEQNFQGIELTATKRLSNKWMLRGYFNYNTWEQKFSGTSGISDPTNFQGGTTQQNGDVATPSVGSGTKDGVWLGTSRWQVNVNGMYQLPYDMSISGNLYGREGYGIPYIDRSGPKDVQIGLIGDRRYDDLWTFDLGFGKTVKFKGTTLELRADVFNLFNANTVLSRKVRVDQPTNVDAITENLSPRVLRLGASMQF